MADRPQISPGETMVLKAVWRLGKGSVGEIFSAISDSHEMDYATVQTYIRRLETKGYVNSERIGRNKIYRASVRKQTVLREAVDEFVGRMFDGEMLPMVRHLVNSRSMTPDDIEQLQTIVEQLKQQGE